RQLADRVQEQLTGAAPVCWHGGTLLRRLCSTVRIRGPIRPEEKQKNVPARESLPLEQATEADPGVSPVFVGAGARQADDLGGVLERQAPEVAQLDEPGGLGVLGGQARQGFVDVEEDVLPRGAGGFGVVQIDAPSMAAAFVGVLAAGVLDEDAAHG